MMPSGCLKRGLLALTLLVTLGLASARCAAAAADLHPVNIAKSNWGTQVAVSSQFSPTHGAHNLTDGSAEQGRGWLSADSAPLPQTATFTFDQEFPLTRIRVSQTQWTEDMYRTKDLELELTQDGKNWRKLGSLHLANQTKAVAEFTCPPTPARGLRLVITGSYRQVQVCGLGEVEIYTNLPKDKKPPYASTTRDFQWRSLRGTAQDDSYAGSPRVPLVLAR